MDKFSALKQYFGHTAFRPGQEELIDALLSGRDALGVMPTGAGKSMCYQIPALLGDGTALVISPLISLMQDQVAALTQAGVPAAFVNSSLSAAQCREVFRRAEAGGYRLVYVAPERLETADFQRFAAKARLSLVAVDEAHCVSQWGQDFRPGYLAIAEAIERLPRRPVVGAFTATATAQVRDDIVRLLRLRDPLCLTTGFDRPNLYFDVAQPKDKRAYLFAYLAGRREKSGIVYCATRKAVETVCDGLLRHGVSAARYHAGLTEEERRKNQEDFVYDRVRVMVATNAFGMGIDKSNVGFVVHYNMPKNIESYYQEAGRAGRDGEPADCILLFSGGDVQTARFLIRNSQGNDALSEEERSEVLRRDLARLDAMAGYCSTGGCLRAYILRYFGEAADGACGHCGNCDNGFVQKDITVEAQKILSGVARVEKRYARGLGTAAIVGMLRGSGEQRVLRLGLDRLSTYGVLRGVDAREVRAYIEHLIAEGCLERTEGEYPVLQLAGGAGDVLFRGKKVTLSVRAPRAGEDARDAAKPGPTRRGSAASEAAASSFAALDSGLLAALRALRIRLAQEAGVPAYIVFSNATLSDMAARQPHTPVEFLEVSGVGEVKAQKYGKAFLDAIRAYEEEQGGGDA